MMNVDFSVVIPAAGVGHRMQQACPKQYIKLHNKPMLIWTMERFLACSHLNDLVIAIAEDDQHWQHVAIDHAAISTVIGGRLRMHSVLAGLHALQQKHQPDHWVLVHDAARPCLTMESLERLIMLGSTHQTGAVLGIPVIDSVKQLDPMGAISHHVKREALYLAQTPQMFRLGDLVMALEQACERDREVSDEAMAIEYLPLLAPLMVKGERSNIKVTTQQDISLAEFYLQQEGKVR